MSKVQFNSDAVIVSHIVPAPIDRVWEAWTTPSIKKRWWGKSEGLELVLCEMDVRVGGSYRYGMAAKNSTIVEEAAHGVYQRVEPPYLLVYSWTWAGEAPKVKDTLVTVRFEKAGPASTLVTVTHDQQPSAEIATIHENGWTYMLKDLVLQFEG